MARVSALGGIVCAAVAVSPASARADIYTFTDGEGVVHFTNQPSPGGRWRVLYKTGPGKASALRGRTDVVPARDRSPDRYQRYDAHLAEASALYALPEALLRAVIQTESDFDPRVVSSAGARGLMQLMPAAEHDMGVGDVWEPRQNILGGARLLRVLANRFDGDLVNTLAAYHAGASAVERYGGAPPYETTQQYVRTVLRRYGELRAPARSSLAATPRAGARRGVR